jgi:hypothetical protein
MRFFSLIGFLAPITAGFLLLLCPFSARADLPGYAEHVTVTVNHSAGTEDVSGYPVPVPLNTRNLIARGELKADGSDVRFLDSDDATPLPFWMEPETLDTDRTRFWVRIPSLAAGATKTIHLYYNNPAALSASNGAATFDFFDDFDTAPLDPAKWFAAADDYSIAGGVLRINTGCLGLQNPAAFDFEDGTMTETRARFDTFSSGYSGTVPELSSSRFTAGSNGNGDATVLFMRNNGSRRVHYWIGDGSVSSYNIGTGFTGWTSVEDAFAITGVSVTGGDADSTVKLWRDGAELRNFPGIDWSRSLEYLSLGGFYGGSSYNIQDTSYDWVRVRAYTEPEPAVTVNLPIAKLVFTNEERTLVENAVSQPLVLETRDEIDSPRPVAADTTLVLTTPSPTGEFSLNDAPFVPVGQVTLPAGDSSVEIYYRDAVAGTATLGAAENPSRGWTPASQDITVLTYAGQAAREDLGPWTDNAPVTVDNPGGGELVDFQVALTLNTAALVTLGKMNADGSDIRFVDADGTTPLPYWIESGINTDTTRIWVKIPRIPPGEKTIRFYFGNPAAPPLSSGTHTFDFFDGFDGAVLDTDTWFPSANDYTLSGGILRVNRGAVGLESPLEIDLSDGTVTETRARFDVLSSGYSGTVPELSSSRFTTGSNGNGDATVLFMRTNGSRNVHYWIGDGSVSSYNIGTGFTGWTSVEDAFAITGVSVTGGDADSTVKLWRDGGELGAFSGIDWSKSLEYLSLGGFQGTSNYNIQDTSYDWVRVRRFADVEPAAVLELPVTRLAFSSPRRSTYEDRVSPVLTIESQDDTGAAQAVSEAVTIRLSSSSPRGEFSLFEDFSSTVDEATLPAGASSLNFYYRDSDAGSPVLEAAETPSRELGGRVPTDRRSPASLGGLLPDSARHFKRLSLAPDRLRGVRDRGHGDAGRGGTHEPRRQRHPFPGRRRDRRAALLDRIGHEHRRHPDLGAGARNSPGRQNDLPLLRQPGRRPRIGRRRDLPPFRRLRRGRPGYRPVVSLGRRRRALRRGPSYQPGGARPAISAAVPAPGRLHERDPRALRHLFLRLFRDRAGTFFLPVHRREQRERRRHRAVHAKQRLEKSPLLDRRRKRILLQYRFRVHGVELGRKRLCDYRGLGHGRRRGFHREAVAGRRRASKLSRDRLVPVAGLFVPRWFLRRILLQHPGHLLRLGTHPPLRGTRTGGHRRRDGRNRDPAAGIHHGRTIAGPKPGVPGIPGGMPGRKRSAESRGRRPHHPPRIHFRRRTFRRRFAALGMERFKQPLAGPFRGAKRGVVSVP